MSRYLLNPFDEADRLVQDRGDWIVATVVPRLSWPQRKQVVVYRDMDFILFPQSEDENAGIGLRADSYRLDANNARKWIMRFCSALSWAERKGIEIIAWSRGSIPRRINVLRGQIVVDYLQTDHLPHAETNESKAALALYREGISLDNPFYAFLSLYKVISVIFPIGERRAKWISAALDHLDDNHAKERRDQLIARDIDVGQYIWTQGRCAIAHAEKHPYVNPDEVDDHFRLYQDIPLLKNLAELAVERRTGIRRSHKIFQDHLYELRGFRQVVADNVMKMLEGSKPIPEGTTINFPDLNSVLARRGPKIHAFQNMYPEIAGRIEGGLVMDFVSNDQVIRIRVTLNFVEERLQFDPLHGIGFTPDRNDKQRIRNEIEVLEFQRCILSNGRLEIWNQELRLCLADLKHTSQLTVLLMTNFIQQNLQNCANC